MKKIRFLFFTAATLVLSYQHVTAQLCPYASDDCDLCPTVILSPDPLTCPGGPYISPVPTVLMPSSMTVRSWYWTPGSFVTPASGGAGTLPGATTFTPLTTTSYTLSVEGMGPNILADGDFSAWTLMWPCFGTGYTYYSGSAMPDGEYSVGTDPALLNPMFYSMTDHTGGTSPNMLIVNSGPASPTTPCWAEYEIPLCAGKKYNFTAWYANLENAPIPFFAPQLRVEVIDPIAGVPLYISTIYSTLGPGGTWNPIDFDFSSGTSTMVNIYIYEVNPNYSPVDFALDDISLNRLCTGSATMTINVASISGPANVCMGQRVTLSSIPAGGVWISGTPTVATVDIATGEVSGVSIGTATISYYSPLGCVVTTSITVIPSPSPITGPDHGCSGDLIMMSSTPPGGVWAATPWWAATLSVGPSIGNFYLWSPGVATISYTQGGCTVTKDVTVNMVPPTIPSVYICIGASTLMTSSPAGGTWSGGTPGIATITPGGLLTAVGPGTTAVTYTTAEGCSNSAYVEVFDCSGGGGGSSSVHYIMYPPGIYCQGESATATLAIGIPGGGVWSESGGAIWIDPVTGFFIGIAGGTSIISYTVGGVTYTTSITIVPALYPCVTSTYGPPTAGFTFTGVPIGAIVHYELYTWSGWWPCATGTFTVTTLPAFLPYTSVLAAAGCTGNAVRVCVDRVEYAGCVWNSYCCASINPPYPKENPGGTVSEAPEEVPLSVMPNPNNGSFKIAGVLADAPKSGQATIEVIDMLGKVVYSETSEMNDGQVNEHIVLNNSIANGVYIIKVRTDGASKVIRFELNR